MKAARAENVATTARGAAFTALVALASCARAPAPLAARADAALLRAREFLVAHQDSDGAWRSRTYANLKDGWSLTLPAAKTLMFGPLDDHARGAWERALERTARAPEPDGRIDAQRLGLGYPVYTAALAVIVLTRSNEARFVVARDAWLGFLREQQLDEDEGWSELDASFGGFGYGLVPPRAGTAGASAFEADISSTLFALGAFRIAGVPRDDPAVRNARRFVERCHNWPLEGSARDPALDDGGFFFTTANEFQNKAGTAGVDSFGRARYRSYGSATADGVRALLACGFERDDPRVEAACVWLERHFSTDANPGVFEGVRAVERESTYFYWCWSIAHAFNELGVESVATSDGAVDWRVELGEALLVRQRPEGTWANAYTMVKEDDPFVATPLACSALALCVLRVPAGSTAR